MTELTEDRVKEIIKKEIAKVLPNIVKQVKIDLIKELRLKTGSGIR